MTHDNSLSVVGVDSYPPSAFNPNAFNLISYRRPKQENTILYFPERPQSGMSTLEELIKDAGVNFIGEISSERMRSPGARDAARVGNTSADAPRGTVVPFLESVYPSAAVFNSGTGAWSSSQVSAALATVDRGAVFKALADIPGQEQAGVLVESPKALALAATSMAATSERAILASSLSPSCMAVREADVKEILDAPVEIFEAAASAASGRRLLLRPFTGLNAGEREILCDGIMVGGELAFCAFSEKHRIDREPPYMDRRIATLSDLDEALAAALRGVVEQVLARLGVRNAVFHSEHALGKSGPVLTDLMTRPGGGFIPDMVAAQHGVDLRAAHVYAAFAMEEDLIRIARSAKDHGGAVAIAACYAKEQGRIRPGAADGLVDRFEHDERVLVFNVETTASNATVGLPDIRACLAVRGDSPEAAVRDLDALVDEFGLD
jgi:hypothetical protein